MECDQMKTDNKKSIKVEHESRLGKEFIRALNLLYSQDTKSAEELKMMLQAEIAKQNRSKRPKLRTYQRRNKRRKVLVDVVENECSGPEDSLKKTIDEDVHPDNIPRISIPDEDQNEGAACKVCNVPEFGPLTLIQCDLCKTYYHPLCHQPPIIDVCLQESNLFWQCAECEQSNQSE